MANPLRATDVFAPGSYPTYTYVARDDTDVESRLRDALETTGMIVTIAGPSKSGKTVLVERVVGNDDLIPITGAGISAPATIWNRVLDWMGQPNEVSRINSSETGSSVGGTGSVEGSIPLLAKGTASATTGRTQGTSSTEEIRYDRRGLAQVVREIGDSDFVVLIDDFHYVDRDAQGLVAEELKEAVRQKVKIVLAAVPHRADDVIRAQSDLRGRVAALRVAYWDSNSLAKIAHLGFDQLNLKIDDDAISRFVEESAGSPQLMQAICLAACRELEHRERTEYLRDYSLTDDQLRGIFERTVATTDYRTLVDILLEGPKRRGRPRLVFPMSGNTEGDVYECILRAVAMDPPRQSLKYDEINRRIAMICTGQSPVGSSVSGACVHMAKLALNHLPSQRVLDWDEEKGVLDIPDPYLLFYLRWSGRLWR